jgi:hypothetical protein
MGKGLSTFFYRTKLQSIGQWIGEVSAMTDRFKLWVYYGDYRASAGHNAHIINGKLIKQPDIFDG